MLQCWKNDPKMRPPFKKLVITVANVIVKVEKEKISDKRGTSNVSYVNCLSMNPTCAAAPSPESFPLWGKVASN